MFHKTQFIASLEKEPKMPTKVNKYFVFVTLCVCVIVYCYTVLLNQYGLILF